MSNLVFVTKNDGKFHTARKDLEKYGITLIQREIELPEPRTYDFREIAKGKALYAAEKLNEPLIVNDAGFFMSSYGGFPRTYVNFALETLGIEGMLKLFEGTDRRCEFRQAVAYWEPGIGSPQVFEAVVPGMASTEIKGVERPEQWSRLWLIFIPEGQRKTLAEMSEMEFNNWRINRGKSVFDLFGEWYVSR